MGNCVMSHNKTTVAGQNTSTSGNVAVSMSNLADTNFSSLATNQAPIWNGSQWVNGSVPTGTTEYILLGQGENSGARYPISNVPSQAARHIWWYDTSPINTITGASVDWSGLAGWYYRITLPAGQYLIMMNTNVPFSASGYLVYNLTAGSGNSPRTASAKIGDNATAYSGGCASTIHSYLSLSSTTSLEATVLAASNVSTNRNHYQGITDEQTSLVVMKV